MDEVEYFANEQWHHDFNEIEKALKSLNEGRNRDCFPLVSFGWKDADLDPEGCTGIKQIIQLDDDGITIEVGGHKTFVPLEDVDEDPDLEFAEQELISDIGFPGDWTGDDWCMYMEDKEIKVAWVMDEALGQPDYEKTAEKIIEVAREAVREFEETMAQAHEDFYKLHEDFEENNE